MTKEDQPMALRPKASQPTETLSFSCPPDLKAWLLAYVRPKGPSKSEVVRWAVELGQLWVYALGNNAARIESMAARERVTLDRFVGELIERGLTQYEREHTGENRPTP